MIGTALKPRAGSGCLTVKQRSILEMIAEGMQNKQIARELGISYWTVAKHAKCIYRALGVGNRRDAVAMLREETR